MSVSLGYKVGFDSKYEKGSSFYLSVNFEFVEENSKEWNNKSEIHKNKFNISLGDIKFIKEIKIDVIDWDIV